MINITRATCTNTRTNSCVHIIVGTRTNTGINTNNTTMMIGCITNINTDMHNQITTIIVFCNSICTNIILITIIIIRINLITIGSNTEIIIVISITIH